MLTGVVAFATHFHRHNWRPCCGQAQNCSTVFNKNHWAGAQATGVAEPGHAPESSLELRPVAARCSSFCGAWHGRCCWGSPGAAATTPAKPAAAAKRGAKSAVPAALVVLAGAGVGELEVAVGFPVEGACRESGAGQAGSRCKFQRGGTCEFSCSRGSQVGSHGSAGWGHANAGRRCTARTHSPVVWASVRQVSTMVGVM